MDFEKKLLEFIGKNRLMPARGRVLVGVSGGPDSMALLAGLSRLRHALGVQLCAGHFNHRFRPESGKDERFVADWCRRLNVPLTVGRRTGGRVRHLSEDQARQMRFKFFIQTARRQKARVALGHTQGDLAETVLMRLMRGSGLYGLRAMMPERGMEGVVFVRPLLAMTRRDTEGYLKSQKIPFCLDKTNRQMLYERNKIRHKLLPQMAREYNPRISGALSDLAMSACEDYDFIAALARKEFQKNAVAAPRKVKMGLKVLNSRHPSIRRLMLRSMVEHLAHDPSVLDFEHIRALEALVLPQGHGMVDLPQRLKAVKTRHFLELWHV